ncbi:MAG TPA: hypothetical protein VFU90_11340 [Candidatus Tumulicola sp.]|nr:hypothetical protein [Candidatus Tumulicola sp.]
MIHAIGEQLAAALAAAGIPLPVIDGPERRPTGTFARERIVLEPAGDDRFESNHKATKNPKTKFSRVVSYKATLYVQAQSKGAMEWEHKVRAEALLDQVIIALEAIVKARANMWAPKSGKFVLPADLKDTETPGGAIYEFTFTIDRGITTDSWTGQAAPQVTASAGFVTNQTNVTVNGTGTPETSCG